MRFSTLVPLGVCCIYLCGNVGKPGDCLKEILVTLRYLEIRLLWWKSTRNETIAGEFLM